MSQIDLRQSLIEWLEDQRDFEFLPLAKTIIRSKLQQLNPAAIRALANPPQTPNPKTVQLASESPSQKQAPKEIPVQKPLVKPAPQKQQMPVAAASNSPSQKGIGPGKALCDVKLQHGSLEELKQSFAECSRCGIAARRKNLVFGVGNPNAKLVLIGEAPGAEEDRLGDLFVGPSGQLLDKILAAIGFDRESVYICNIIKCRPPNDRDPNATEVHNCTPYLLQQLAHLKPKVLLALGKVAGKTLLGQETSLSQMRQQTHEFRGVPLIVTYHPAALLRNPHWKRPCWEDVQKAAALCK